MLAVQLKAFFAVARLGSVTLASKQLGLSQPTVTTQIRALEERYGVELFRRGGGRLAISDAGVKLLPQVEQLLQQESSIEFALRNSGELQSGNLRIGVTAPYLVLDFVKRFQARYPGVEVTITVGNSRQMIDALQEYRVDIANSSHLVSDARLFKREIGHNPLVLVVHEQDPLARLKAIDIQVLQDCRLLIREPGSMTRQLSEQVLESGGVSPAAMMEIGSRESIREAILRGMGVSLFGAHEVPGHPALRVIPFKHPVPHLSEYLYGLKERRQSGLIKAFLEACLEGPVDSDATKLS